MTQRTGIAAISAALLALGLFSVPAAAQAAYPAQSSERTPCEVTAAQLNWGVKESFRSYISGSIANGEWTTSDDMRYETPEFVWDQSTGAYDPSLDSGSIEFTGAVHFTGHEGAMQLDLANPVIEFEGGDTAYLQLVMGSTDQAGGAVTDEPVRVAKIDLAGKVKSSGTELEIAAAIPRLTAEGASAFNGDYGSYVAGENLDPVTLTATVSGCELTESAPSASPEEDEPTMHASDQSEAQIPWLPIIVGGVALVVIGVTVGMLISGRRKPQNPEAPAGPDASE